MPLKTLYLQQVLPEIRKGVKACLPHWDTSATMLADIMETGQSVERDEEIRIRFLSHKEKEKSRDRERSPKLDRRRESWRHKQDRREPRPFHNCGQIGHWIKECKDPRKMRRDSNEKMHCDSNEKSLEGETEEARDLLRKLQAIQTYILGKNDNPPGKNT